VILKGRVAIHVGGNLVEKRGTRGLFGEMALVDRTPRLASVVAESPCNLLAIKPQRVSQSGKAQPPLCRSLLAAVSARARYTATR